MLTNVEYKVTESEIVSLELAKKQLRIELDYEEEDDLIQSYIDTAVEYAEVFTGGSLREKEMIMTRDSFESPIVFEAFPLKEITDVKYLPADGGVELTMLADDYKLTKQTEKNYQLRFRNETPATVKSFEAVTISLKLGYTEIPKPIIQAILLKITDMYERREDRSEVVSTVGDGLLRAYKKY